jgi:chaperone required for assembly of F1-ATPase
MTEFETKPGVKLPTPEDNRPRRFYKDVTVEAGDSGWLVLLDGRSIKTPAKKMLALPTEALAMILAGEWAEQGERIDPPLMPATRLAFVTLDRMAETRAETCAEIAKYASTDLLCFRAPQPPDLALAQAAAWDPLLAWAKSDLGAELVAVAGVIPADQDPVALQAILARAALLDDWQLTTLAHITALCGSAILGLALLEGRIDAEQTFALSTIDESYQISQWGEDEEAASRLTALRNEVVVAGRVLRALAAPSIA